MSDLINNPKIETDSEGRWIKVSGKASNFQTNEVFITISREKDKYKLIYSDKKPTFYNNIDELYKQLERSFLFDCFPEIPKSKDILVTLYEKEQEKFLEKYKDYKNKPYIIGDIEKNKNEEKLLELFFNNNFEIIHLPNNQIQINIWEEVIIRPGLSSDGFFSDKKNKEEITKNINLVNLIDNLIEALSSRHSEYQRNISLLSHFFHNCEYEYLGGGYDGVHEGM